MAVEHRCVRHCGMIWAERERTKKNPKKNAQGFVIHDIKKDHCGISRNEPELQPDICFKHNIIELTFKLSTKIIVPGKVVRTSCKVNTLQT